MSTSVLAWVSDADRQAPQPRPGDQPTPVTPVGVEHQER